MSKLFHCWVSCLSCLLNIPSRAYVKKIGTLEIEIHLNILHRELAGSFRTPQTPETPEIPETAAAAAVIEHAPDASGPAQVSPGVGDVRTR